MKITSLKQQVKNPERVSVFVDGKYSFSLTVDQILSEKINNGQEIDTGEVKRLKKLSADGKLRSRALEWAMNRPRSVREFQDYLRKKKAHPEQIESLTNEFIAKQYLDELVYAAWYVDLAQRRHKSFRAIKVELIKKGIDREVAEQVMQKANIDEETSLKELVAKKKRLSRYKNDPAKLAKYLTNQGFSYRAVKQALTLDLSED